jgi:uncharacterized protein YjbI with pentapeptide repeats
LRDNQRIVLSRLREANLRGANLRNADLAYSNLCAPTYETRTATEQNLFLSDAETRRRALNGI